MGGGGRRAFCSAATVELPPEKTPHARAAKRASEDLVLCSSRDPLRVARRDCLDVVGDPRAAVEAPDELAHMTRKDVRSVPALPQRTVIGQRPGVVRVPTFHVHEMRLPRFGYSPAAVDGPL
jgi:hypothetical protein